MQIWLSLAISLRSAHRPGGDATRRKRPETAEEVFPRRRFWIVAMAGRRNLWICIFHGIGLKGSASHDVQVTRVCKGTGDFNAVTAAISSKPDRTAVSIIFMSLRIAKVDEHAVAHILREKAAKALHSLGNAFLIGRNDLAEVFRVHAGRQGRRAHKVGKHHRDLATFGAVFGRGVG